MAVFLASTFSCFAVFAVAGVLMALLPAPVFRRVSLLVRFNLAVLLLALLGTSFAVPHWLTQLSVADAHRVAVLPPVSFLGLARTVWGRGREPFAAGMTKAAVAALEAGFFTTILAYAVSFRRSFIRIPETPDTGPLPRVPFSLSPLLRLRDVLLHTPAQRACYPFAARTLLRSDGHLQVVSGFMALNSTKPDPSPGACSCCFVFPGLSPHASYRRWHFGAGRSPCSTLQYSLSAPLSWWKYCSSGFAKSLLHAPIQPSRATPGSPSSPICSAISSSPMASRKLKIGL